MRAIAGSAARKPTNDGEEQRHLVVHAVDDQHGDERHQRERADLLGARRRFGHRRQHFVDGQLRLQRLFVVAGAS